MSSNEDRDYIVDRLIPEITKDFDIWGLEYQQERDLGIRGEFANLYRKVRKLKTTIWDGVDSSGWRESKRTILKEVVAHGLLALVDLDADEQALQASRREQAAIQALKEKRDRAASVSGPPADMFSATGNGVVRCGIECEAGHTYVGLCSLRIARNGSS